MSWTKSTSPPDIRPADGTYRVSPPDTRDFRIGAVLDVMTPVAQLPASLDLSPKMLPPRDQGDQSSCVAFSSAAMREYFALMHQNINYNLSPQFLYDLRPDNGLGYVYPRDALATMKNVGIAPGSVYPERSGDAKSTPPAAAIQSAAAFKEATYWGVTTSDECKVALYDHGPCIFSVMVYKNAPDATRFWAPDPNGDPSTGGHMMTFVGYDSSKGLKVRNSWGPTWNGDGHTWMPFADWQYVKEAWCITPILPPPADPLLAPPTPTPILLASRWAKVCFPLISTDFGFTIPFRSNEALTRPVGV